MPGPFKRAFVVRRTAQNVAKKVVSIVRVVRIAQLVLLTLLVVVFGAAIWSIVQPSAAPIALAVAAICLSIPLMVLIGVVTAPLLAKGPIQTAKKLARADLLPATRKEHKKAQKVLTKRAKAAKKAVQAAQEAQAALEAMEVSVPKTKKQSKESVRGSRTRRPARPKLRKRVEA